MPPRLFYKACLEQQVSHPNSQSFLTTVYDFMSVLRKNRKGNSCQIVNTYLSTEYFWLNRFRNGNLSPKPNPERDYTYFLLLVHQPPPPKKSGDKEDP